MEILREINPALQLYVKEAFKKANKVDLSLESILEGQHGGNIKIVIDNGTHPKAVQLMQGCFTVFSENANSSEAAAMIANLHRDCFVQPSPEDWIQLLYRIHGNRVKKFKRYSFSSESVDVKQLNNIIESSAYKDVVSRINLETAQSMSEDTLHKYHFMNYETVNDFVNTSFGFCIKIGGKVVAACSAGLVCRRGVEICIISSPGYREKGFASLVAATFVIYCIENKLEPHWDAANIMSANLARKLGYTYSGEYEVFAISEGYLKSFFRKAHRQLGIFKRRLKAKKGIGA
ncbi:MAG: GNAT family N-acetyltransferase [Chitinivibrionales bacterium]|nr:GNAT family N-acetyltransferase [Chitinivibrionales bacterium]